MSQIDTKLNIGLHKFPVTNYLLHLPKRKRNFFTFCIVIHIFTRFTISKCEIKTSYFILIMLYFMFLQ